MNCADAQLIISSVYDGETHGALPEAKEHCRSCPECAAFVKTLAAVHRLPAPEMPAAALERTLAALRDEYPTVAETQPAQPAHDEPATVVEVGEVVRPSARAWAPWAVAAAALFIVAGIVTAQGVRYLLQPTDATLSEDVTLFGTDTAPRVESDPSAPNGPTDDVAAADILTGPSYIRFGESVYRLAATVERTAAAGARLGTVTSSFDTGEPAESVPVFADPASDAVIVVTAEESYLRFEPVVRTLRGTPYALRSGDISAFGQWPSLPPGIPEPSAPDGTPVFIEAGTDDAGVTVYVRPGTDPADGFAVAPGTSPADPAAGNTGWTWWEPAR